MLRSRVALLTAKWLCALHPGKPIATASELIKTSHFYSDEERARTAVFQNRCGLMGKVQAFSRTPPPGAQRQAEAPFWVFMFHFHVQRACFSESGTLTPPLSPGPLCAQLCRSRWLPQSRHFPKRNYIFLASLDILVSPSDGQDAS